MLENLREMLNMEIGLFNLTLFTVIVLTSLIIHFLVKKRVLKIVEAIAAKTTTHWDDYFFNRRVFHKAVHLVPLLIIYLSAALLPNYQPILSKFLHVLILFVTVNTFDAFLSAVNDIYLTMTLSKGKPIKGFLQIVKILAYFFASVSTISILLGKSPSIILSGLGALTAILLLVFKDTILSVVASFQISGNNLIQIGDWIEAPQFSADGDVVDIALHMVTIQNWDKTLVTIPTYKLVDGAFKNWKGMQESGGRRIKRSINIDISSIKICDEAMLKRFEKFHYISGYIENKQKELSEFNKKNKIDDSNIINGRRMTNIGVFRAYVYEYLKSNPNINKNMTLLVRQLQPGPTGQPIEIYVFTSTTEWAKYESIQSDIFDHILAVIKEFELKVYQYAGTVIGESTKP
ncbi:MAG: mechanosensitive ion channel [Candidatus Cloacimonetes bacterium]|nr:mechanosensitive ion channel [Candidatus Cloacimonadota bacterium]